MNDFAQAFDPIKKIVVFSRSLENVEEKNASIIRTNLRVEMLKLKKQEGKNILTGGVDIRDTTALLRPTGVPDSPATDRE